VLLLAENIETWGDFKVAKDMGFDIFQGYFFLWPTGSLVQKEIKSLDVCLVGILQELEKPEPSFKAISDLIEHDLGLSYKLLRLVNSAYMAPKYKIRSISQALTYLGTRELHQWISMLMFSGVKNDENSELVSMSLIRGKMMALIAQELQMPQSGSEPFFTGLFSVIDVILNREMNTVLTGLPLPDDVKAALTGGGNELSALLDFVVAYEQANWQKVESKAPMNKIPPQQLVSFYLAAHQWSKVEDQPSWDM
jgi:EAL and modified HD-GYP domain-containing signal transduction protein